MDYKTSGVDVEAGRAFIDRIRSSVEGTHKEEVIGGIGGFGGSIRLPEGMKKPVLVAGTDGVGTKLELAQKYDFHFGVGIDLVAMCVNDVITNGAKPLFFLDYIATGSLTPEALCQVIEGIAAGCKSSDCALLGGETAEMPGFYPKGRYDLAGFCVAVVEEEELIYPSRVKAGDQIIGIASSGLHSNGFSLVRKILSMTDVNETTVFGNSNSLLLETLMRPTALYVHLVKCLLEKNVDIHGMAHITGGGLPENLPRCLPKGLIAFLDPKSWEIPEIYKWLQLKGKVPEKDLWNTFNLGVGFSLVASEKATQEILQICLEQGFDAWVMGNVQQISSSTSQGLIGLPY